MDDKPAGTAHSKSRPASDSRSSSSRSSTSLQKRISDRITGLQQPFAPERPVAPAAENMPRDGASTRHPAGDAARALIDLLKVDPAKLSDDEVCVFCDLLDGDEREPACGPSVRPAPPPAPSIAIVKGPAVAVQAPQAMHLPAASPVRRSSAAKPRSPRRSRVVGFGIVGAVAGSALAAVASAVLFLGPGELTAAPHHAMPTYWAQSTAASGWIGPNNSGIGPAWAWREAMALRLASGGNDGATDVQGGALTTIAMRSSDERSSGTVESASAAGDRHHLVGSETASRLELAIDLVIEPGPVRRVRLPLRDPAPADAEPLATIIIENVPLAVALSIGQRTTPTTWLVSPSQLDDLYLVLADDAPRETSLRIAALERSGRTVAQFALKVAFISPAPFAAPFSGETTASIAPSSADQARPPNVASATGPVISHHPVAKLASVQPVKSAKPERPARTARLQPTSATNAQVDLPHEPAPPRPIIIKRVPPADAPEPEVVLAPAKDRKPMRLGVGPDQPEPRAAANESAVIVEQPRRNWYQKSVDWAPRESIR